jgi:hypothetical protein
MLLKLQFCDYKMQRLSLNKLIQKEIFKHGTTKPEQNIFGTQGGVRAKHIKYCVHYAFCFMTKTCRSNVYSVTLELIRCTVKSWQHEFCFHLVACLVNGRGRRLCVLQLWSPLITELPCDKVRKVHLWNT